MRGKVTWVGKAELQVFFFKGEGNGRGLQGCNTGPNPATRRNNTLKYAKIFEITYSKVFQIPYAKVFQIPYAKGYSSVFLLKLIIHFCIIA